MMSVAVAQSIEAGFIPYNFAETPKVTVSFTRTVTGWYNVKFPRMKRPLFTLSPAAAQLLGIDGKFTLGCVMADVDAIYELFVRRWIENDAEVFVHLTKFDLVAWYAVEGEKLDEAEEYRHRCMGTRCIGMKITTKRYCAATHRDFEPFERVVYIPADNDCVSVEAAESIDTTKEYRLYIPANQLQCTEIPRNVRCSCGT